jgi:hypothetical protein
LSLREGRFLPDEAVSTSKSEIATPRHSVEARNDIQAATWINLLISFNFPPGKYLPTSYKSVVILIYSLNFNME